MKQFSRGKVYETYEYTFACTLNEEGSSRLALLPPPEPRPTPKPTLSVRIDTDLRDLLDRYCEFARCGRQHVVQEALKMAFRQDADFQRWLESRSDNPPSARENLQNEAIQHRPS